MSQSLPSPRPLISLKSSDDGQIVLTGSTLPATRTAPSAFTMAPYAWLLTDQDIADVVSFIQTSWGNRGAVATSSNVTALRQSARE
jgi:mono/diheme cytochrome c family protein